jgi:uncharacterized protein with HEPN domain
VNDDYRIADWLGKLLSALDQASELAARGRTAFDDDPALPLAFEALSNRISDLAKELSAAAPERFSDPIWSQAARNRDFVVHRYASITNEVLWETVERDFPRLRASASSV